MSDLAERLRRLNKCRRCSCPACDRDPAGELHGHICTNGEGCVETQAKLRSWRIGAIYIALEAASYITELEKENKKLKRELTDILYEIVEYRRKETT